MTKRGKHTQELRLQPNIVPRPLARRSVFKALEGRKDWRKIREYVIDAARGSCQICGARREKGMICHEVWHYEDKKWIATLVDFILICPDCNQVIHYGNVMAWEGDLSKDPTALALDHLIRVNGVVLKDAITLLTEASDKWSKRSKHDWKIVISPNLIERFPILAQLEL